MNIYTTTATVTEVTERHMNTGNARVVLDLGNATTLDLKVPKDADIAQYFGKELKIIIQTFDKPELPPTTLEPKADFRKSGFLGMRTKKICVECGQDVKV